ncbi:SDR family oxidoreductase [Emcibacter sp.]|uniref:SDR family oxidoreductase n=1 Tax=Emcibacter sp. TaxID=1979954 RepID=UPI002AA63578|nr:SDR family oxidoreductase [Emcibacter sp.]
MIIITGASGQFGRAAAELLLQKVPAGQIILTSRSPEKLAEFKKQGAHVRYADFDDTESLGSAFEGGTKMLLISTARVGTRVSQHRNAIEAAVAAGVNHIAYTSIISADEPDNPAIVKLDHRATEEIMEQSGADWTFLRDSQYAEAIAGAMVPGALIAGKLPDNCGEGKVAFVSRDDCVAVAVGVLTQEGHRNKAYDLTGPELLTIPEAMAIAGEIIGRPIEVVPAGDEDMFAYFDSLGAPRHASDIVPDGPIPWSSDDMVTFGQAIREGYFNKINDNVERISGKAPKSLREVMLTHRHLWPV